MGVKLFGGFQSRQDKDAPHSFLFKPRVSLSVEEATSVLQSAPAPGQPRQQHHAKDVFCITKRWMHSQERNGPPALTLPHVLSEQLHTPGPTMEKRKLDLSNERKRDLCKLAEALEELAVHWAPEHSYYRSGTALRKLVDAKTGAATQHRILWSAPEHYVEVVQPTQNRYFNTLPDLAWNLFAKFEKLAAPEAAAGPAVS